MHKAAVLLALASSATTTTDSSLAAADSNTPPPSSPPSPQYPGSPGAWLDFRISLSSSFSTPDRSALFNLHLVACAFVPLVLFYAAHVLWVKVVRPRSWPFRSVDGRLVPRANEASLVFVFVLLFFRWTHALILVLDVLPLFAVRELSNDLTFAVFYFISSVFIISLVEGFQTVHRQEVYRVWSFIFPLVYFFPFLASLAGPLLGILSGLSADRDDYAEALRLVQVHYVYWASLFALNAILAAVAGINLRSRIGKALAVATDPAIVRSLKSSRFTATSMMVLHNIAMISYGATFFVYAADRTRVHSTQWIQYTFCAVWLFSLPTVCLLFYIFTHISYLQSTRRDDAVGHRSGGGGTSSRILLRRESISTTASTAPLSTSAAATPAASASAPPLTSSSSSSSSSSSYSLQYPSATPHPNRHPTWLHSPPAAPDPFTAAAPPQQQQYHPQSWPSAAWSSPSTLMPHAAADSGFSQEPAAGAARYPPSGSGLARWGDAGERSGPT